MGTRRKTAKKPPGQKRIRSKTADKVRVLLDEIVALQARESEYSVELQRFDDRDLPQFKQWLETNHSEKQKQLEAILNETEILQISLEEAQHAYTNGKFTCPREAILEVEKEVREEFANLNRGADGPGNPDPPGRPPADVVDTLFESFLRGVKGIHPDKIDPETLARHRSDFEATFDHVAEGNYAAFEKAMLRLASDNGDASQSAAKIVFRRLVRRLHPDHHPDFGTFEKGLWNEAMDCYEVKDAQGLETVELKLQIHLREEIAPAQTPALRRYRDELTLRRENRLEALEEATCHPAWKFSLKRKTKAFLRSMQNELEEAIHEATHRLKVLTSLFNQAKRSKSSGRKSRRVKKHVSRKGAPAKKAVPTPNRAAKKAGSDLVQDEFQF